MKNAETSRIRTAKTSLISTEGNDLNGTNETNSSGISTDIDSAPSLNTSRLALKMKKYEAKTRKKVPRRLKLLKVLMKSMRSSVIPYTQCFFGTMAVVVADRTVAERCVLGADCRTEFVEGGFL
ncbi:hypothetical protein E3N88_21583 [Mikania micrantha]|uniref:Uncharacterized protein n=1 Tax=Mikania micrantha TaxID=192012 RepID=A0A5N6N7Y0_9ASTR|nr:hypothetical protein E3N88_21583 [Mikania micrantha]